LGQIEQLRGIHRQAQAFKADLERMNAQLERVETVSLTR
jgi:hypothetical protein